MFVGFFIVGVVGKAWWSLKQPSIYTVFSEVPSYGIGVYKTMKFFCIVMVFPIAFSFLLNIIRFAKS